MSERFLFRVEKGHLTPADEHTVEALRSKGYHIGDILAATLYKPRNPQFNRLAHALGRLIAENIEAFHGMSSHEVLKRLQVEGNIACEEIRVATAGGTELLYAIPKSLSFASMDEGEFKETYRAMCQYVSDRYWTELTPEQVNEMAELMPEAV